MDAASLLRPPADQRDDHLPRAYLAHRLEVTSESVPIPSTQVAGWRSLAYYDPPPKKGGEPPYRRPLPLRGVWYARARWAAPCASDLCRAGWRRQGRAGQSVQWSAARSEEVGPAQGGSERCRMRRLVWRSNSGTAPGPRRGHRDTAAVALGHRRELETGELVVAAALSTAGIRSFQPWPNTRQITVAADRDEGSPDDDRGHRAGEKAARDLALAHHEHLEVRIALPGASDEDIDWLDVLRCEGVEAVRVGLQAAPRYAPTSREIEGARQRAIRAAELAEIERTYPLPAMESLSLAYQHTRTGKVMVHKYVGKNKEGNEVWLPIATPLGVPARLRAADQQGAYGLRVTVRGMDGHPRAVEFDRAGLARMGASEIRGHLFAAGLRVEHDGEIVAVQVLKAAIPRPRSSSCPGRAGIGCPASRIRCSSPQAAKSSAHPRTVRWSLRPMRASPIPFMPEPWTAGAPR
jgi:hypothetical protein